VFPVFSAGGGFAMEGFQGGADFTVVADPATFKVLPWAPRTGWVLCDAYMADGKPCPYRDAADPAARRSSSSGRTGPGLHRRLEVEFHVFKLDDPRLDLGDSGQPGEPPRVSLLSHGHQYLTELRYDRLDPVMELLRSQTSSRSACRCARWKSNTARASSS
jgi:glutamine synthetase